MFKKIRRSKKFKTIFLRSNKKRGRPKKKKFPFLALFLILFILLIVIPGLFAGIWFKKNVLDTLPNIENIEKIIFSQTTTITDRNDVVLYKIFNENRKYVDVEDISKNMQTAVVDMEDKKFWSNPGIDVQGIIRAGVRDVVFKTKQGASTITQQLIKNVLLTNERTITRKLKEIVLAFQLNSFLTEKIEQQYKGLSEDQIRRKVKEKILEMYLNYIFFGDNSYGVEAASKTYFHKSAKDLDVLEAAILASIPKSPTKFNPATNRDKNLGYMTYYLSGEKQELTGGFKDLVENSYIEYLKGQSFALLKQEDDIIRTLSPKNLYFKNIKIEYTNGRKDYALARMYLEGNIDKTQFIQAIKEGLNKKIYSQKVEIKAPWFVFNVIQQLEEKYGKEVIEQAGWTIKTSLDYNIQEIAENTVKKRGPTLAKDNANNAALVYLDSVQGDIIAYVGSKDYYNKEIDGQVDMITSERQCGSVIKPLIYANAFMENPGLTPESPIYDTKFDIADKGGSFNNFDGKFMGLINMKKALGHSRNIPAGKMYFLGGAEEKVKTFLRSLGLTTISEKIFYGYPLAVGAAEVRMIDMAGAYTNLSAQDGPAEINPILEIKGPSGNLIYSKKVEKKERIIPISIVSFMRYILSNADNRPASWNSVMQIAGFKMATKSGTTNIIDQKTGRKLPRDGWFIGYTPSKVFVAWAGNTKGEPMGPRAFGGRTAGKIRKDFTQQLIDKKLIENEDMDLKGTSYNHINAIDGNKAGNETPTQITVKALSSIDNKIGKYDPNSVKMVKIDTLCNGLVSEYTPKSAQKYAYIINSTQSNEPNKKSWQDSVTRWWETDGINRYSKIFDAPVFLKKPEETCAERAIIAEKGTLKFDLTYPGNNSKLARVFDLRLNVRNKPFKIQKVEILIDGQLVQSSSFQNIIGVYLKDKVSLGKHILTVKMIDEKGYEDSKNIDIEIIGTDNTPPYLDSKTESGGEYIYIFKDKSSRVLGGWLTCNGQTRRFTGAITKSKYGDCTYEPIDYYGNR